MDKRDEIETGTSVQVESGGTSDRRQQRRAKTDLFVNRFMNGQPYLCRMTDISRSGARLVAINEPRLNPAPRFMGLQFQLPGRREIVTAMGEAVTTAEGRAEGRAQGRAQGRAIGIRFTRLPASAATVIDELVSSVREGV